ncbi:MAG: chloride channel protein [Bacteroidota bacterium]
MLNDTIKGILIWRAKNISQKQLLIILSVLIGLIAGIAAVTLKTIVHYIEYILTHSFASNKEIFLYLATPLLGILLTVLFIKVFIKDNIGHGISRILYAISKKNGNIKSHNTYSSIISCALTTGLGGSVGMEAPIVYTGSSIGSTIGRFFRLSYKTKVLLIGCGAAAAVSGIFKAPIAGVVFVLEILMLDLTTASIIPLLIASVSASVVSYLFLGSQIIFYFSIKDIFVFRNLLFYLPLGIFAGFISLYFTKMNNVVESTMKKVRNDYSRIIVGGVLIGILIFVFPPLYGEGYLAIKSLLGGSSVEVFNNSLFYQFKDSAWLFIAYLALILVFKVFATALTTGSGGIGGVFAPALFMGAFAGYSFSKVINLLLPNMHVSERNFSLVGMAGLMSGIMHAPLTAIFLIAEITGSYELFLPLMVTASASYMTVKIFQPYSIYAKKLAERGELITHHKDKAVLTLLNIKEVVETNFSTVGPNETLGNIINVVKESNRNIFPVVDDDNNFLGYIQLDDIRSIMFDRSLYNNTYAHELMTHPPVNVSMTDQMEEVMNKFNKYNQWNLPVIENEKYVGFISRSNLFSAYRKLLVEFSED